MGIGEWDSVGTNGFGFTYLNFHFDSAGTFKGSRLSGRATLSTLAPNGSRLSPDRRFTFAGRRVAVEAP
jgi:hypothetical protein